MERGNGFSSNGNGHHPEALRQNRVSNEHQVIQRRWQELIYQGTPDVVGRLQNFQGEAQEVIAEVARDTLDTINNLPQDRRESLGGEVVDTIIAGLGILDTLGLDFESMFYKKIGIMYEKYQPAQLYDLMDSGMSHRDAMATLKSNWQNKNGS